MRTGTTLIIILIISAGTASGGAWTRQQNSWYAKLAFTTLRASEAYDQNGDKFTTPDFHTWSVNLYGEYGITNELTGIVRVPFVRSAGYETSESFSGVGDLSVELKYGLVRGNTPVSFALEADFPAGDPDATGQLNDGSGSVPLPTGDGEYNTRLKGSVSHSFHPIPGYVSLDAGYNFRTMGFTDEYLFGLQGGYQIDNRLWIQGNIYGKGPISTPDSVLASKAVLGFGEGVRFIAYSLGLALDVTPHLNVSFDAYSAFGKITSIYSGLNLVFGLAFQY
jgi:hypothetical protein